MSRQPRSPAFCDPPNAFSIQHSIFDIRYSIFNLPPRNAPLDSVIDPRAELFYYPRAMDWQPHARNAVNSIVFDEVADFDFGGFSDDTELPNWFVAHARIVIVA